VLLQPGEGAVRSLLDRASRGRERLTLGSYDNAFGAAWTALGEDLSAWRRTSGLGDTDADRRARRVRGLGVATGRAHRGPAGEPRRTSTAAASVSGTITPRLTASDPISWSRNSGATRWSMTGDQGTEQHGGGEVHAEDDGRRYEPPGRRGGHRGRPGVVPARRASTPSTATTAP
jgi:hypothetical protein